MLVWSPSPFRSDPTGNGLILTGGSPAVFVLEPGRQQVYAIDDPAHPRPHLVLKTGDVISQVRLNDLVQVAANGNQLDAMDNQFHLFTYTPGGTGATLVGLQAPASSTRAAAVATYGGNFYLLDSRSGQIWRYYQFEPVATGYLSSAQPQLLKGSTGLAIDGDVYVSQSGGKVIKFASGAQVKFPMQVPFALTHVAQIYTQPGFHDLCISWIRGAAASSRSAKRVITTPPSNCHTP